MLEITFLVYTGVSLLSVGACYLCCRKWRDGDVDEQTAAPDLSVEQTAASDELTAASEERCELGGVTYHVANVPGHVVVNPVCPESALKEAAGSKASLVAEAEAKDEEELCAMCIMPLDKGDANLVWLPCLHCFHNTDECHLIREWLQKNQSCPICMTRVVIG